LPATRMVAPNSPRARANESTVPDSTPRQASGRSTSKNARHGPRPRVRAGAPHQKRERHDRRSENDAAPGKRDVEAEGGVERAAEGTVAAEEQEQREADRGRRQHERQGDQRFYQRPAAPAPAREKPGHGDPGRQIQGRGRGRRREGEEDDLS